MTAGGILDRIDHDDARRRLFRRSNLNLTFAPTSVRVAKSGELASELGTYRLSFTTPDGPVQDEGTFSTTWQKIGGQWKVVSFLTGRSAQQQELTAEDAEDAEEQRKEEQPSLQLVHYALNALP